MIFLKTIVTIQCKIYQFDDAQTHNNFNGFLLRKNDKF